jgi:predicted enzyme related to lactoylglutathione lyase
MSKPLVHLELHTGDLRGARDFYAQLCGWRGETVSSYLALDLGRCSGGMVECPIKEPLWLPYVEVASIAAATDRARLLGASVPLEPREGPAGWRSVVRTPAGGEVALWQAKR